MNKKVVFLTGGTGVMGTEAIKKFLEHTDEFEVRALIRPSEKNRAKVEAYGDALTVVWGDLTDWNLLERSMEGVDYVLHIGALLNPLCTDYPPEVTLKTNYGSTLAMLRGIKRFGQQDTTHFVYVGTVEETGHHAMPKHWGRVGDPLQPPVYSYYALSKCASERAVAESGLKYWASVRQSFQNPNNPVAMDYPIVGEMPYDNCSEHIDSESSGNLMLQICLNAPEEFWRHGYNIGGGEGFRFVQHEWLRALHGDIRAGWEPKWLARKNYHGQFFSDSDRLQELVPYRLKTGEQLLHDELRFQIGVLKSRPRMTPEESKQHNHDICAKPEGTVWAAEHSEEHLRVYYGSREKYEAIPDDWAKIELKSPSMTPTYLDHGFDESKPVAELDIEDMRQAARFRGGECLSESMVKGDMYTPLRWRCAHGHEFEATPNLVLFMGHWCPEELRGEWNYYEQARVNPFFAQCWDYEHEGEEPFAVKMACDDTLISPDFK